MDDTIYRQAAIDHFRLIIDATDTDSWYNMGFVDGIEFCISCLSTMPSAQPEIIRCKDCARYDKKRGCNLTDGLNVATENCFCSYGERRDG